MKRFKAATTVGCMALMAAVLAPVARADDWNRKTVITFSGPVEIPGVHLTGWGVLPAGTYVFKILDSQSDRHIVQIFNKDETTIYATILAIPNYRLKATDKTVITFTRKTGRRAGSAARLVLSRQKLGRGIRLSEGARRSLWPRPPTRRSSLPRSRFLSKLPSRSSRWTRR